MNFRRKFLIVGAVVLSLGLFAGCGPHVHHRLRDRDFSKHVMKRLDSRVKKLDLSETQKKKYEEIRLKIQANLTKGVEERNKFFRVLQSEIDRENPDMNAVAGLVKKQLKEMPGLMEDNLDLFVEFYNVLDEDQKARLIKMIQKKIGKGRTCFKSPFRLGQSQ